jgi:putative transposase
VEKTLRNRYLGKSINDDAWSYFRYWLEYFGYKDIKITISVTTHYTSQDYLNCSQKVQKYLYCEFIFDKNVDTAINIKKRL